MTDFLIPIKLILVLFWTANFLMLKVVGGCQGQRVEVTCDRMWSQLKYTGSFVSGWGLVYSLVTVVVTVPVWLL